MRSICAFDKNICCSGFRQYLSPQSGWAGIVTWIGTGVEKGLMGPCFSLLSGCVIPAVSGLKPKHSLNPVLTHIEHK